jgi:hypothetical protein
MAKNVPTDPTKDAPIEEEMQVEIQPDVIVADETVREPDNDVVGYDQGGVYTPHNVNIVSTPGGSSPRAASTADKRIVFTNTRFPELKVSVVKDGKRTGRFLKFNSTKLVVDNEEDAKTLESLNLPGVYREPSGFFSSPEDKFFTHGATGFRTLSKDAYEDWVNHSEWAVAPGR